MSVTPNVVGVFLANLQSTFCVHKVKLEYEKKLLAVKNIIYGSK